MKCRALVVAVAVSMARIASGQTLPPEAINGVPSLAAPVADPAQGVVQTPPLATPAFDPPPSLFRSIGRDTKSFFSTDTARVLGVFAAAGLSARPLDVRTARTAGGWLSTDTAGVGNWAGKFYVQAGGGLATYLIGRATGNPRVAAVGGDVIRAQVLSQAFVQATKFAVGRERPDASNSLSFPSGHSASAFATATVLQQHFGWKAGVPAYALAGLVGASRMASSKHYLSDVLVGAGIGLAAGRTATLHLGRERFVVGAAPTAGGAMVTFTRK
jgi:membrane-associated phospholipid phosphatase